MKSKITKYLLLTVACVFFALPVAAQSITFSTGLGVGKTIKLQIEANGPVTATGIVGEIKSNGTNSYKLTSQKVTLTGDIKKFGCNSGKLTSLELRDCSNLTALGCNENELTSLDISHCPSLTALSCYTNLLTSLKLTDNTLDRLVCFDNKLASLDVSKCGKLTYLACSSNALKTLDISNCPKLTYLGCSKNKLTTLDLSKCQELQTFWCDNNAITSLSVANQESLRFLNCENNKITSLNLSNCNNITTLYCDNNQLTQLDLKQTPKLTVLSCSGNSLTSLDATSCPNLKRLFAYTNQLTSLDLSKCKDIEYISCEENLLDCAVMEAIAEALPTKTVSNKGTFDALSQVESNALPGKGNILTKHIVEIIKSKNWDVFCTKEAGSDNKTEYRGRNGSCTDYEPVNTIIFTTTRAIGETITLSIKSEGEVTAKGIRETTIDQGKKSTYTLSSQTVELSGNITELDCESNDLTSLDVSMCPSIEQLFCGNNKIASLDLSKCSEIKKLYCYKNQLSSLNISQCYEIKELACYKNQLTSLDVSKFGKLTDLVCFSNKLTSLKVAECTQLNWLSCEDNLLSCTAMENIVEELAQRVQNDPGSLIVLSKEEMNATPGNGNIMTKQNVEVAKSKFWKVLYVSKEGTIDYSNYVGREGTCTENGLSFAVTVSKAINGQIIIKGANNLEAVPYGTELTVEVAPEVGYELDKLMANNEDITESKSFVVKSNVTITATFKTDAEAVARESASLYPNPASTEAMLCGVAQMSEVRLYGMDGTLLQTVTADEEGSARLYLEGLPEGTYPIVFLNALGVSNSVTLIIKR